jgi:LCP family protein required for cell wall assembly
VFGSNVVSLADAGRYNVLLLGGDSGDGRVGLRPDSLSVASIDAETGRTVLVGLPRNLADVPFPEGSVMHEQFPHGFDCEGCYLNGVNTWAEDHKELFPGVNEPGMTATKQAIEEATGLRINYYAMVNLAGFESLVDAVGGVRIHVPEDVPIGGIGAPVTGYVKAGTRVLDGKETLWFARSRVANNDYSRMARQKCVMSAMLQQLDPRTVAFNVQQIAASSKQMLSTDLPRSELDTFMELALQARAAKVSAVSIVPPAIDTYDPDYDKARRMVDKTIARSESSAAAGDGSARRKRLAAKPDKARAAAVNATKDLSSVC